MKWNNWIVEMIQKWSNKNPDCENIQCGKIQENIEKILIVKKSKNKINNCEKLNKSC